MGNILNLIWGNRGVYNQLILDVVNRIIVWGGPAEMVFVCRTGSCPTLIMDALSRRELPFDKECELDLIVIGAEMECLSRTN